MSPDQSGKDEVTDLIAGQVRELVKLVNETDIAELRIERGDLKLYIVKGKSEGSSHDAGREGELTVVVEPQVQETFIVAPMVGRFYRAQPGSSPFVESGSAVAKGQRICIVESMKILNEVLSDYDGLIDDILCEDGQAVEYGQPLFRVRLNPADTLTPTESQ